MPRDLHAVRMRWLFPGDGPPLEDVVVEINDGRIRAIRPARSSESDVLDFGRTAAISGLINVHTHLEFSHLTTPLTPPRPFAEWIRAVVADRRTRGGSLPETVRSGLHESADAGTATIGEIATPGWTRDVFDETTCRGVLFRECIALDAQAADTLLADVQNEVAGPLLEKRSDLRFGLSPHAPYSVHPELFAALADVANARALPLAVHLAETEEELQLLRAATGPLVELFRESGFWRPHVIPLRSKPLDYLRLMQKAPSALVIHGNYLDSEEVDYISRHPNFSVVYCPRTHAYFGHKPHPWRSLIARGVRVVLGTDSRASNPDLSVWNDVCFLKSMAADIDPDVLLRMVTVDAAKALGLSDVTGSVTVGKAADFTIIQPEEETDPTTNLFTPGSLVVATIRDGRLIAGGEVSPPTQP